MDRAAPPQKGNLMKRTTKRKLSLDLETIRMLSRRDLDAAAGGMNGTWNCTYLCNGGGYETFTCGVYTNNCTADSTCCTGIGC